MPSMILAALLFFAASAVNASPCENVVQKITAIKSVIERIKEQSKDACEDYGIEKFDGHDHMDPTRHDLRLFTVCYESQQLNLGTLIKPCLSDHSGHIIGKEIGGPGEPHNLFAQTGWLNIKLWERVADKITKHLRQTEKAECANFRAKTSKHLVQRTATIEVAFVYNEPRFPYRPSSFYYIFKLYEDGTKTKTMLGKFDNASHDYVDLIECDIDCAHQLFEVKPSDESHKVLQTCDVADQYKHFFGS
ncbi:hypothetical protein M3Y96_01056600 [Aphelenchoides besseyi]|nr:hypothetical protein M3Y96_01056600 [Aphelenchoides besseyi]